MATELLSLRPQSAALLRSGRVAGSHARGVARLVAKPAWMASPCGLAVAFLVAVMGLPHAGAHRGQRCGPRSSFCHLSHIVGHLLGHRAVSRHCRDRPVRDHQDITSAVSRRTRACRCCSSRSPSRVSRRRCGFWRTGAIAATMLVGLGFSAFNASAACLLANTAPVAFGSIGIPLTHARSHHRSAREQARRCHGSHLPARRHHHSALHRARHGRAARDTRHLASHADLRLGLRRAQYLVAKFLGPQRPTLSPRSPPSPHSSLLFACAAIPPTRSRLRHALAPTAVPCTPHLS